MNDIFTLNLALIFRMKYGLKLNFIFKGDEVGRGWRAREKGYRWLGGKTFIYKFSAYAYDRNH